MPIYVLSSALPMPVAKPDSPTTGTSKSGGASSHAEVTAGRPSKKRALVDPEDILDEDEDGGHCG